MTLSLCLLSWKCHRTLVNTLTSYRDKGLLALADEKLIYFQEVTPADTKIAQRFGFTWLGTSENVGIGNAMKTLCEQASGDLVLLLENDWVLIEDLALQPREFLDAQQLLLNCEVDAVRLRHRDQPGLPFWAEANVKDNEKAFPSHLLWSVCWHERPDLVFPHHITRLQADPPMFAASSANADFTFNPCLYRRDFIRKVLAMACDLDAIVPMSDEMEIQTWWERQPITVAQGVGLFTHLELDSPYSRYLRRLAPIRWFCERSVRFETVLDRLEKSVHFRMQGKTK